LLAHLALLSGWLVSQGWAQELSPAQVNIISARMDESALKSWELGVRAQAILEFNATTYSVFSATPLPPPARVPDALSAALAPYFGIARDIVGAQNATGDGPQPLMEDGSAADPAANGPCVLLANWTAADGADSANDYAGAARRQLEYLLSDVVPKTADGAISHRVSEVQLWSDFMYMVPPFLAYYGAMTGNRTLLEQAHDQARLYRDHLRDKKTGLWRHVVMGDEWDDEGFWTTGQGWAAAGMLRVHATIQNSAYAGDLRKEQGDLKKWVVELLNDAYEYLDSTGLFANYADQSPTVGDAGFYDAAGTAAVAYSAYRACTHLDACGSIPAAERSRQALFASAGAPDDSNGAFAGMEHFTEDGWLTPVVNPHSVHEEGEKSGEGQAFVVLLHAAYSEWRDAGMKSAASPRLAGLSPSVAVAMCLGQALLWALGDHWYI